MESFKKVLSIILFTVLISINFNSAIKAEVNLDIDKREESLVKEQEEKINNQEAIQDGMNSYMTRWLDEDVNYDCIVDIKDLGIVASRYNQIVNDGAQESEYDLNEDSIIDLYDLIKVSKLVGGPQYIINGTYQEDDNRIKYTGAWEVTIDSNYSKEYSKKSIKKYDKLELYFYGTGIEWYGTFSTSGGKANVSIDGNIIETKSQYLFSNFYNKLVFSSSDLALGIHKLTIENIGEKDIASTGYDVSIDRIIVNNSTVYKDNYSIYQAIDNYEYYIGQYPTIEESKKHAKLYDKTYIVDYDDNLIWSNRYYVMLNNNVYDRCYTLEEAKSIAEKIPGTVIKTVDENEIVFTDKYLESAIRIAINKPTGQLCKSDIFGITKLNLCLKQISDITGLENISTLRELDLGCNRIVDINKLKTMKNLNKLILNSNQISDISALVGLSKIECLRLFDNEINNINSLSSLTNLNILNIDSNQISDISALNGLIKLQELTLGNNKINNIRSLKGLVNLSKLDMYGNEISDISVLADLRKLQYIKLGDNQISDINVLKKLEELKWINFDCNQIEDISALAELRKLQGIDLGHNKISEINELKELKELRSINLDYNQIKDISAIGELEKLTEVNLGYNQISDINELKGLRELKRLRLDYNQISDINALEELNKLETISLSYNKIADVSILKNIKSLTGLYLYNNQIKDISAIEELVNLRELNLSYNQISDIAPISRLTNLNDLQLDNNKISNINPLKGLINLRYISLRFNQVSNEDIQSLKKALSNCNIYS